MAPVSADDDFSPADYIANDDNGLPVILVQGYTKLTIAQARRVVEAAEEMERENDSVKSLTGLICDFSKKTQFEEDRQIAIAIIRAGWHRRPDQGRPQAEII
jgi:hypothetical protein